MPEPKTNLDQLMRDPKAAALLKNKDMLKTLMQSPDTQRLMSLLNQSAGEGLKSAAASAAKGDTGALTGLLQHVMHSKEGAQLVERINRSASQASQNKT